MFTGTEMVLLDDDLLCCNTGKLLQFWSCSFSSELGRKIAEMLSRCDGQAGQAATLIVKGM